MTTWEYLEVDLADTGKGRDEIDILNEAGDEGWELVVVLPPSRAIFKRQRPAAARSTSATRKPAGLAPTKRS